MIIVINANKCYIILQSQDFLPEKWYINAIIDGLISCHKKQKSEARVLNCKY